MSNSIDKIRHLLSEKHLKVTPQRIAILDAIHKLGGHPTAEKIIAHIRKSNPNIASGTVYKVLETFVEHKLIKKVTTENDVMRYDGIMSNHHHLYAENGDIIEDYVDEELDVLLNDYFQKKKIEGFQIKEFMLQIKGSFDEKR